MLLILLFVLSFHNDLSFLALFLVTFVFVWFVCLYNGIFNGNMYILSCWIIHPTPTFTDS